MDEMTLTLRGSLLATLDRLAAVRDVTIPEVLSAAVAHEVWLTSCALRGATVYAEANAFRDHLQMSEVPPIYHRD